MGRPAKAVEDKRKLIGARFDPADRQRLEQHAEEAGRSTSAEVERRAIATLGLDDRGLELVAMIAAEVQHIESQTGRRWHAHQRTWYAVSELMRSLPPHYTEPELKDEDLDDAREAVTDLCDRRRDLVVELNAMGLHVPEFPDHTGTDDFLGDTRTVWRQLVEGSKPSTARERALILLEQLARFDEQIEQAGREAARLSVLPIEEELEGREIYRRRLQAEARRRRNEGAPFDVRHLTGDFQ